VTCDACSSLYAAGDVARFPYFLTIESVRIEHWSHAQQVRGLRVVGCGLWVVGCGLWVVGCGLWFVVFLWFMVYCLWFIVCGLWFVVYGLWFHSVQCGRVAGRNAAGRSQKFETVPYFWTMQVWGLGFGVWGLGFGVWGLVFGVWGLHHHHQ
jgi:hypothetical protein